MKRSPWPKRAIVAGLASMLVLWMVLLTFDADEAMARYLEQSLVIEQIDLHESALTEGEGEGEGACVKAMVEAALPALSSCLVRDGKSRAPLTIDFALDGEVRWTVDSPEGGDEACLNAAMPTSCPIDAPKSVHLVPAADHAGVAKRAAWKMRVAQRPTLTPTLGR